MSRIVKGPPSWASRTQFAGNEGELRARLEKDLRQSAKDAATGHGKAPAIIWDLDGTLVDNRPRTLGIVRDWLATPDGQRLSPSFTQKLSKLVKEDIQYSLQETLAGIGISPSDIERSMKTLEPYWKQHFLHDNATLRADEAYEGAPEFVKKLAREFGAQIIYMTGRHEELRPGTIASLEALNFPSPAKQKALLLLNPRDGGDDAFKRETTTKLLEIYDVVATFDNEPANVIAFADSAPDAVNVFVETSASQKQPRPGRKADDIYPMDWDAEEGGAIDDAVESIRADDVEGLRGYLDAGGNINATESVCGLSLLQAAAARGSTACLSLLLNHRPPADVNQRHASSSALPLHFAAQSGNAQAVKLLLEKAPEQLDAPCPMSGHTPLVEAAFNLFLREGEGSEVHRGYVDILRHLIARGANREATSLLGRGVLSGAYGSTAFVGSDHPAHAELKALFYGGALPTDLTRRHDRCHRALLASLAPPIPKAADEISLQRAADILNGQLQRFMDAASEYPADVAALDRMVALLDRLPKNVQPAVFNRPAGPLGQTALHVAARALNARSQMSGRELIDELLDRGARITQDDGTLMVERHPMGVTAPFRAAVFGHALILERLLRAIPEHHRATVLAQPGPTNGFTMVLDAIAGGHLDAVRVLLTYGARVTPDIVTYQGLDAETLARRRANAPTAMEKDRRLLELVADAARRQGEILPDAPDGKD